MSLNKKETRHLKSKRFLVTGAAGFIGSSLSYKLLHESENIVCVDNFNDYYDPSLKHSRKQRLDSCHIEKGSDKDSYIFETLDLKNKEAVFSLFERYKFDTVCHLAAQAGVRYSIDYPQTYIDNNITATLNLLAWPPHIFNISSTAISSPSITELGSMPLSNLYFASVFKLNSRDVFLIEEG